jgi:ribosomal protein L22
VVIGVTDEETAVVDAWYKTKKPGYPIVILKNREFEGALGVQGFPTQAVIAPDGNLIYAGYAAESKLAEAMSKAKKGSIWPKKLEKVADLIRVQQYDKAYADVTKLLAGGLDAPDVPKADKLKVYLERCSADAVAEGRELLDKGRIYEAHRRITPFAAAATPFPNAEEAKKLLADVEAVPAFKEELKGGELFVAAQDLEAARNYLDAFDGYKAVFKKYGSTRIGAAAKERAEDLIRRGMPGYAPECESCVRQKKACDKHAEKVKL